MAGTAANANMLEAVNKRNMVILLFKLRLQLETADMVVYGLGLPTGTSIEWLNEENGDNVATLQRKKFTRSRFNCCIISTQLVIDKQTGQIDYFSLKFTLTENEQNFNAR